MSNVFFLLFAFVCFLGQVGYSIYYSIKIVDISTQVNQIQKKISDNQTSLQETKSRYFELNSISNIDSQSSNKQLIPITKTLQLK